MMGRDERLLNRARSLFPKLNETEVHPVRTVEPEQIGNNYFAREAESFETRHLSSGDAVVLDFGDHETGYLTVKFSSEGAHPDAPVWIRVRFAERLSELFENAEKYHGWVSKAWIQEAQLHLEVLPGEVTLPRRYAFRYVRLEVIDCSTKFSLMVKEALVRAVSSAEESALTTYICRDPDMAELDRIAVRTLHECMQKVFEDGPKRDRRLWMGDLRLEALANYETYHADDLVKQGLYLFAGDTNAEGRIAADFFIEPDLEADDVEMFDYSLFFAAALRDYYAATKDEEALDDLYGTAIRQVELAEKRLGTDGVIMDSDVMGWCFVDWNLQLNKQAAAHGIYLYALLAAADLAGYRMDSEREKTFRQLHSEGVEAVRSALFDEVSGVFVSGEKRQVSYASQCWLILGGALSPEEGAEVLQKLESLDGTECMVTPYMYHHYIQALINCGLSQKAKEVLKSYWGGMAKDGADTFFELYRPGFPNESPYGGTIVNSYCHAWSCAPAYFIRKYQW